MTATSLFVDDATAANFTRMRRDAPPGNGDAESPLRESELRLPRGMPAGGGYSTVGDLYRFGAALRGGRLVSAETLATLISAKAEMGRRPDGSSAYGYGFVIRDNGASFGHGGGAPGVNGELRVRTDSPWIVATLGNTDPPQASEAAAAVERALTDPEDPSYCF
jgi:CubicO group peptidase (beta-lactamase class C family)